MNTWNPIHMTEKIKDIFGGSNIKERGTSSHMESSASNTTTRPSSGHSIPLTRYPHCDGNVLHAPKECVYCDMYPDRQQERILLNINFTGEMNPKKKPCPAEMERGAEKINRWGGNRAHTLHQKALEILTETQDINQDTSYTLFNEDYQF